MFGICNDEDSNRSERLGVARVRLPCFLLCPAEVCSPRVAKLIVSYVIMPSPMISGLCRRYGHLVDILDVGSGHCRSQLANLVDKYGFNEFLIIVTNDIIFTIPAKSRVLIGNEYVFLQIFKGSVY